ncbi:MAG: tetratricopeptide repeat protein [Planctomycetaceae bacterium]|nr:MAG: tetratricopeptide repeat protein [Planctomycetaceae bacterium]
MSNSVSSPVPAANQSPAFQHLATGQDADSSLSVVGQTGPSAKAKACDRNRDYAAMIAKLKAGGRDAWSMDALGVCHLRTGEVAEALRIFRSLVLKPGCTWERSDVPLRYRRNFATALLMAGIPSGCREVLSALPDQSDPRTRQLLAAIARWERSLSFFKRWDFRINKIEPKGCTVPIDFEPGEFEDEALS